MKIYAEAKIVLELDETERHVMKSILDEVVSKSRMMGHDEYHHDKAKTALAMRILQEAIL